MPLELGIPPPLRIFALVAYFSVATQLGAEEAKAPEEYKTIREEIQVKPGIPPYIVELTSHPATEHGNVTLRITGGPKGYQPQTAEASVTYLGSLKIEPIDVNMDGYMDFRFAIEWIRHSHNVYDYWCYDPRTQTFIEHNEFEDIISVDPKTGLLYTTEFKDKQHESQEQFYRIKAGKLDLVKTIATYPVEEVANLLPRGYNAADNVSITTVYEDHKAPRIFYRACKELEPDPAQAFAWAMQGGDLPRLKRLVARYPDLAKDASVFTGNVKITAFLLDHGVSANRTFANGYTDLHGAATNNEVDIARVLLAHGANPNSVGGEQHYTPLYVAVINERPKIVQLLLAHGADPNIPDSEGRTPLKRAEDSRIDVIQNPELDTIIAALKKAHAK